jgi:hypothetical protein
LTLLSFIMVDRTSSAPPQIIERRTTWKDADATFHTATEIQKHLSVQDAQLAQQDGRLEQIIAALSRAYPEAAPELNK